MEETESSPNQQVRPPLLTYSLIGDEEAVIRILSQGINVDQEDFAGGCTALHLASASGHINIVKILLQHGAKPEKQDSSTLLIAWPTRRQHIIIAIALSSSSALQGS
ncbi:Ankyrin-2 [Folsomia candida]|uniref:Ankyrin-2 n=1 Tax=Folsomia candida TaxID=158441 RepID=A0A226F759_FOLCA|nr:Ankyrin-2 [Folsomia candida]